VRVRNILSEPLSGVLVTFAVSRGGGQLATAAVRTDESGIASTTYRAGTTGGFNEIQAVVSGLDPITFNVVGLPGSPRSVAIGQRWLRYALGTDSLVASASLRDTFANNTAGLISWVARDPTLVSVGQIGSSAAGVKVLKRPGMTWLVATNGAAIDSLPVMVFDATSTPCTFQATPVTLAIGGSQTFDAGTTCIRSDVAGAEYAVVAHLGTAAYLVSQTFEVVPDGIVPPPGPFPIIAPSSVVSSTERDVGFEARLRSREREEIGPRVAGARAAFASSNLIAATSGAASNAIPAAPAEGQVISLNVNAQTFCSLPDARKGRIAAVTKTAVIIADVENPAGGFTDNDYLEFAYQLDTLVVPLDTGTFGSPTDIDGNGRVAVFFTRAVNEMTAMGSPTGVVLGFYYLRDLLPRQSPYGACPGSNVGEMFYLLVPDPSGEVNGNLRTKDFVSRSVVSTIAHEYQHLINASRRMYINNAIRVDEDTWLNEGLSHVAEELLFYRAAGLSPRSNIGGGQLALGTPARFAFDSYMRSNLGRYQQFQRFTESVSPLAANDELPTRGASWAFLRYVADRVGTTDGDLWRRLVNTRLAGVVNLDSALTGTGLTAISAMRDWSTAVLIDDNPTAATKHQQLSWNFVSTFAGAGGSLTYSLAPRVLLNGLTTAVGIVGGGTSYLRFGVAQNTEALIRAQGQTGAPLPAGVRLTVVRIK